MKSTYNDMLRGSLIATLAILLSQTVITITIAEEEYEDEEREGLRGENEEREGLRGENEEREGENRFGGLTGIILYITIGAVVGTIGYVLWKIIKIKSTKVKQQ